MVDIGLVATIGATLSTFIFGVLMAVIGWLVRKIWKLETSEIPNNEERISSLEEQIRGAPGENGGGFIQMSDEQLDSLEEKFEHMEEMLEEAKRDRRRTHAELSDALADIIYVLEEEGFNGDLPDTEDFERKYYRDD